MSWLILLGVIISFLPILALSAYSENNENRIQQHIQKRLAAGEKANRLIDEQSPYLLQHAFNPVDWYPWGEEAFTKAKNEAKPIFLSIGYSTCHWCHVMAHESFEDPKTAALLNRWFVSIKVDREERPDIDQMYMAATQAMTGSGGWPMSVFLLPDATPFYAGTYFPPSLAAGRPGFKDLLTSINRVWREKRAELQESANSIIKEIEKRDRQRPAVIKDDVFERCFTILEQNFDVQEGGFGQAPKFPRPVVLDFLFLHYLTSGNEKAREMTEFTLKKMAEGGMYDQLGGGFHRYSVDKNWFVPHFEKMLYDQMQLAHSYLNAFQLSKDQLYARTANEIFIYLLRDMRDPSGGFYSAEDADSNDPYSPGQHGEGAFYLWTREDIVHRLKPNDANIFITAYGVKNKGNVEQDPMQEFSGRNILYRVKSDEEVAATLQIETQEVRQSLVSSKELLFIARQQRTRPHLDDKLITAWNGRMIGALARGSRILQKPQLLAEAIRTARFLQESLYDTKNNSLLRRYRNQEAGVAGQLSDYSYLVAGLLDLYQADHNPKWLQWATDLTKRQIVEFWNEKEGFFFDSVDDPRVKIRMRGSYDGAEPTGNSVAAHNLLQLAQLQNKPGWQEMAKRLMESFGGVINQYPSSLPLMLTAWHQLNSKPIQVVIAGTAGANDTEALLRVVESNFSRPRLLLLADGADNQEYLAESLPFMRNIAPHKSKATAYVCADFTCKMPVTDPDSLQKLLKEEKIID